MNMEVSIQSANREHLKGIHELALEWGYQPSEPETLEWLEALLNSSNHQVLVAVSDDLVLGWAAVEKRISIDHGFIQKTSNFRVNDLS